MGSSWKSWTVSPKAAGDPDNVDYDKVASDADAVLHLWISEVGLYSSHTSLDYIPRVNAGAKLFVKGADDNIYDGDISTTESTREKARSGPSFRACKVRLSFV